MLRPMSRAPESANTTALSQRRGWLDVAEAGTVLGVRFVVALGTLCGRGPARAFVAVLALYFVLLRRDVRRASTAYLTRMGLSAGFWDVYHHVRCFAEAAVDRLFLLKGEFGRYRITQTGHELMVRLKEEKRGAILLGAHLGSFEAMRMRSDAHDIPLNVVGYFRNTARLNGVLSKINPALNTRFIEVDPDSPSFILKVKERIEAGELVAILGDRVGHGAKTEAKFLGDSVELPTGPYMLAAVLSCPIYLTFGLYQPPNGYDLFCELFAEKVVLTRKHRKEELAAYAQRYAERLEHYCRLAPFSWFNFYDYWLSDAPMRPASVSELHDVARET
jgi:predicted LPLAT superfamily acyltransferase